MQIGDKVWIFDSNHRVYKDDKGNKLVRCWYRGYFVERYILGETNQSWIIGYENASADDRYNVKVNKKTLTYKRETPYDGILYTSEDTIDQLCWIHDNQYEIMEQVRKCNDYNKLKKIQEILTKE